MTAYVVLSLTDDGHWSQRTTEEAHSPKAAIRKFLENTPGAVGELVAVPARSWKPVAVTAETKTTLRFS